MANVREKRINSVEEIVLFLKRREYDGEINKERSPYLYRGLSKDCYNLSTTLSRNCKHQ